MSRPVFNLFLVLLLSLSCSLGACTGPMEQPKVYNNAELGFSFVPPGGFRDVTAAWKEGHGFQTSSQA